MLFRSTRGSTGGVLGAIGAFGWYGFRPVSQVWLPLTHLVTGSDPRGLLAINLALAVLMATALWWLLRLLGVQLAHALAIAGLVLVFPGADSVRLWPAAGISQLAIALWLVGAGVALLGLARTGRRAWAFHGGALALYAAAILTYEAVAGVVMVSVLLYLSRTGWSRWGRRRAASRWEIGRASCRERV